jgi:hypothetical protein
MGHSPKEREGGGGERERARLHACAFLFTFWHKVEQETHSCVHWF